MKKTNFRVPTKNEFYAIVFGLLMVGLLLDNNVNTPTAIFSSMIFGIIILGCLDFWDIRDDIREYKEYRRELKADVQELAQDRFVEATKVGLSRLKKVGCDALEVGDYCDEAAEFWESKGVKVSKYDRNISNEWMPGAEARYGLLLSL